VILSSHLAIEHQSSWIVWNKGIVELFQLISRRFAEKAKTHGLLYDDGLHKIRFYGWLLLRLLCFWLTSLELHVRNNSSLSFSLFLFIK